MEQVPDLLCGRRAEKARIYLKASARRSAEF